MSENVSMIQSENIRMIDHLWPKYNSLGKNLKPEINKVKVSVVDKENFENKKVWHDMLVSWV